MMELLVEMISGTAHMPDSPRVGRVRMGDWGGRWISVAKAHVGSYPMFFNLPHPFPHIYAREIAGVGPTRPLGAQKERILFNYLSLAFYLYQLNCKEVLSW